MLYTMMLALSLGYSSPTDAQNTVSNTDNTNNIELTTSMSGNKENHGGYSIPPVYKNKIESILKEKLPVVSIDGTSSWMFTMDFVLQEMESDWWISKANQLLFIWNSICEQLTGEYMYDGEDGNSKRLEEFEIIIDNSDECWKRYREWIMPFIEKKKAEYRQQSAEARQQSAEYIRETMKADSLWIKEMIGWYKAKTTDTCEDGLVRTAVKEIILDCKKRGIDYKAIILKEVWDMKEVDNVLKFYGIQ